MSQKCGDYVFPLFFVSGVRKIAIYQHLKPFFKKKILFPKNVLVYCSRYTRGDSLCAG